MRALRFAVYWFRYALALVVMVPVILLAIVLAFFMKLGQIADAVYGVLGHLDLFPKPRGKACPACRGRGRYVPMEWSENDTPAAARRRGAGDLPKGDS